MQISQEEEWKQTEWERKAHPGSISLGGAYSANRIVKCEKCGKTIMAKDSYASPATKWDDWCFDCYIKAVREED